MMSDLQIALIAVFIVISAMLGFIFAGIFLTKYQYFEMDFRKGILLKRIKLLRIDLDWKVGKVYEFSKEFGVVKVMNEKEIFIRANLGGERDDYFKFQKNYGPLLLGRIFQSDQELWLEIRMAYPTLVMGLYISSVSSGLFFTGPGFSFIFLGLLVFCSLLGVYFCFIRGWVIRDIIRICRKFCVGLR
ncbi:hypothetical protein [Leptospira sarikeiensis]|uniref:Uncharacterized protein n=1 Tax=Leptospira sarikeiensis TaxID=2484943 RepID=A0A4R9KC01_9LEPT|nr:hypothetical protein [Leptospira sarikeiensis]TGL63606.1 hypothetical protein EHQ64_06550 [Leptospira sarikeiensis]